MAICPKALELMEEALERACLLLPTGSEKHRARRVVASKIIECANRGDTTLSRLGRICRCDATDSFRAARPGPRKKRGRRLRLLLFKSFGASAAFSAVICFTDHTCRPV